MPNFPPIPCCPVVHHFLSKAFAFVRAPLFGRFCFSTILSKFNLVLVLAKPHRDEVTLHLLTSTSRVQIQNKIFSDLRRHYKNWSLSSCSYTKVSGIVVNLKHLRGTREAPGFFCCRLILSTEVNNIPQPSHNLSSFYYSFLGVPLLLVSLHFSLFLYPHVFVPKSYHSNIVKMISFYTHPLFSPQLSIQICKICLRKTSII